MFTPVRPVGGVGLQYLMELLSAIPQAGADRQLTGTDDAGNLSDVELLDVVKHDDSPILVAQLRQAELKVTSALARFEQGIGQRFVAGQIQISLGEHEPRAPAPVPAPVPEQHAIADRVNPGADVTSTIERTHTTEDLLGRYLHQIIQVGRGASGQRAHALVNGGK
jgi:hypothetical protein